MLSEVQKTGIPHEFDGPLGYSTRGLPVLDYLSQRERQHHGHWVGLEVVTQLALSLDYDVDQLLDVGVARFGLGEHFTDEVTGRWMGRACPSSCLSTTTAALTTWVVAAT